MSKYFTLTLALILAVVVIVSSNSVCPGAPEESYGNGQTNCDRPECAFSGSFHPSPDPTKYFVCTGKGRSVEMNCSPGTCFSLRSHGCIHARDWTDVCQREEPVLTPDTTTESETEDPTDSTTEDSTDSTTDSSTDASTDSSTDSSAETETTTAPAPFTGNICPGSDPEVVLPGEFNCQVAPKCDGDAIAGIRVPHADPNRYYECFADLAYAIYDCSAGKCFSAHEQKCVEPTEWVNGCANVEDDFVY